MASLIMASVSTLIRKGYLLAGVMMAANMFVVNEVRAMEENQEKKDMLETNNPEIKNEQNINKNENEGSDESGSKAKGSATQAETLATLLEKKVFINFLGTFAVSCLNNYFNLWDYKSGKYLDWKFGFFGWRTKRFLNDYLQFEVNLNVYRGLGWGILNIVDYEKKAKSQNKISKGHLIFSIVTGFISMPLTLHIFNFSIAISIDSIVYGVVEMVNNRWGKNKNSDVKGIEEGQELKDVNVKDLSKEKDETLEKYKEEGNKPEEEGNKPSDKNNLTENNEDYNRYNEEEGENISSDREDNPNE